MEEAAELGNYLPLSLQEPQGAGVDRLPMMSLQKVAMLLKK